MTGETRGDGRGIRVLPPEVAARIAAGEVVERPVSVVRELLDNALDAGAARISLEVEEGGLALIRVTDDGRGIPPEEVELAFERHATSKIRGADDLAHVRTLGFRGEALPSIAAAGDLELTTRAAGEPAAVHLALVDGQVRRRTARAAPSGTAIAVRELFARLPARRKFVGTAGAEGRHVSVLVAHYALAYPGVAFTLTTGGRRTLATSGDGDLRHAFAAIYGAETASQMLTLDSEREGVRVTGLAGPPGVHRGNRAGIAIFVNGRWVQSRGLTFAVVDAYASLLPIGRSPLASLAVRLADEDVDVNVHPAKAEVRFRDERAVGRAVRQAILVAMELAPAVRWEPQPATESATGNRFGSQSLRARLEPPMALRGPQPTQPRLAIGTPNGAAGGPMAQRELLPVLRVVGQLAGTYVVCEGPDGMYLLDQHAAHERVVYDRLLERRTGAPASQQLLDPALAELDVNLASTLEEHRVQLEGLGLAVEPFGPMTYLVRALPVGIAGSDVVAAVRGLLEQLAGERRLPDSFDRAAATVACHASVRAGTALALEEMRRLVSDLEATTAPRTCPHGRPTLVHLGTESIERQFGRR